MKISIVTICRNDAKGLTKTIESIRRQTYSNIEYIIIDGASTDSTLDIIKSNYDIIDKWVSEPDSGIYNAMNKSIERCSGDYVIFMNSGDCFHSHNAIEDVFSVTQTADVIYGDVIFDSVQHANCNIRTLQDFFCKSPFCHQGVFTRLDCVRKERFKETLNIVADWAMFVDLFIGGSTFKYVPVIIAKCQTGGVSSDSGRNNNERLQYLESILTSRITEDYKELQQLKSGVLYKYYRRIERSKKLKYYMRTVLEFLHI